MAAKKKVSNGRNAGLAKAAKLRGQYAAFRDEQACREEVERARRTVFHNLMEMTLGNIESAKQGNSQALRALLEFAGVDGIPPMNGAGAVQVKRAPVPSQVVEKRDPVEAFSKKVGLSVAGGSRQ